MNTGIMGPLNLFSLSELEHLMLYGPLGIVEKETVLVNWRHASKNILHKCLLHGILSLKVNEVTLPGIFLSSLVIHQH